MLYTQHPFNSEVRKICSDNIIYIWPLGFLCIQTGNPQIRQKTIYPVEVDIDHSISLVYLVQKSLKNIRYIFKFKFKLEFNDIFST